MSQEFRGFTDSDPAPEHLYDFYRFTEEARSFLGALVTRLNTRISGARFHVGRDDRGGRDYYFENFEIHIRGRRDPCFLGFFHYAQSQDHAGSWFQLWDRETDDDPVIDVPLAELARRAGEAAETGRLSDMLSNIVADIKKELGLH